MVGKVKALAAFFAGTLALIVGVSAVAVAGAQHRARTWTQDRNGDGRADVWYRTDPSGERLLVQIDSNFDGRPDIQEYYDRGNLLRRELDRDFNNQIDMVEEFDPVTHQPVRSIIDVDLDGTADLLVLFQDGRPAYSKVSAAGMRTATARTSLAPFEGGALVALKDPFASDTAVRNTRTFSPGPRCVGLSTSGGMAAEGMRVGAPAAARRQAAPATHAISPASSLPFSSRAPPVA